MPVVLIIGYGNLLREDDAIGRHAAQALKQQFRNDPEIRVTSAQQLTPEMAEEISNCAFVLFLDACCATEPGQIRLTDVSPGIESGGFTHQVTPSSLLETARQLYGTAPTAKCLTFDGCSFGIAMELSSKAHLLLPHFIGAAVEIVEAQRSLAAMAGIKALLGKP